MRKLSGWTSCLLHTESASLTFDRVINSHRSSGRHLVVMARSPQKRARLMAPERMPLPRTMLSSRIYSFTPTREYATWLARSSTLAPPWKKDVYGASLRCTTYSVADWQYRWSTTARTLEDSREMTRSMFKISRGLSGSISHILRCARDILDMQ